MGNHCKLLITAAIRKWPRYSFRLFCFFSDSPPIESSVKNPQPFGLNNSGTLGLDKILRFLYFFVAILSLGFGYVWEQFWGPHWAKKKNEHCLVKRRRVRKKRPILRPCPHFEDVSELSKIWLWYSLCLYVKASQGKRWHKVQDLRWRSIFQNRLFGGENKYISPPMDANFGAKIASKARLLLYWSSDFFRLDIFLGYLLHFEIMKTVSHPWKPFQR